MPEGKSFVKAGLQTHLAMPEDPCRAKRDEDAGGGKEAISTCFQRRVHGVQAALSVNVGMAGG